MYFSNDEQNDLWEEEWMISESEVIILEFPKSLDQFIWTGRDRTDYNTVQKYAVID